MHTFTHTHTHTHSHTHTHTHREEPFGESATLLAKTAQAAEQLAADKTMQVRRPAPHFPHRFSIFAPLRILGFLTLYVVESEEQVYLYTSTTVIVLRLCFYLFSLSLFSLEL